MIIENLQDSGDINAKIIADKMLKVAADKDQEVQKINKCRSFPEKLLS